MIDAMRTDSIGLPGSGRGGFFVVAAFRERHKLEKIMAKGQLRSNREVRKPKKAKVAAAAPAAPMKGLTDAQVHPKKKT